MNALNRFLDTLPRTRFGQYTREVPAFRTCGIVGFYSALIVAMAGGLLADRSLLVVAALALTCALSFFVYAYVRRWITGHEELVLLEHVWFAEACAAVVLWLLGEPVLGYLDVIAPALCVFLAAGRVGCLLVGCCHGKPSSVGISYGDSCGRDGFAEHLVGVRLFPVQVLEAVGLVAIGLSGFVALPFAVEGKVFIWFLIAYAVMRFGLEGLRGDRRPQLLGLSQARWMAIVEVGLALRLTPGEDHVSVVGVYAALFVTLVAALALRWGRDSGRRLCAPLYVREVRELAGAEIERRAHDPLAPPVSRATLQRVRVAVSAAGAAWPNMAYVSLSLPEGRNDLPLLCELAVRAFRELICDAAQFTGGRVLHFLVPRALAHGEVDPKSAQHLSGALYGCVLRRLQLDAEGTSRDSHATEATASGTAPPWFFADVLKKRAAGADRRGSAASGRVG